MGTRAALVIYDLEYTAWEGSQARGWSLDWEERELVQIGAVLLDRDLAEVECLDLLVRPVKNPILSDYFIDLTRISQERLEREGRPLAEALDRFARFAGSEAPLWANGGAYGVLVHNCALQGLDMPLTARRFRSIRDELCAALGRDSHIYSCDLPELAGCAEVQPAHDGLGDARAIAMALRALRHTEAIGGLLQGLDG